MLKSTLNKWDSMSLSIGVVIGIGIFRVPAEIAKLLSGNGPIILLAWLVGGLISLLGALCYAELAATFPETGGDYVFLRQAYGKLVAFLYAWTELLIIRTGSIAAISFLFADYACGLLSIDLSMAKLLALAVICILTALNLAGLTYGVKVQNTLTLTKLIAITLLILAGLFSGKGDLAPILTVPKLDLNLSFFSSFALALIPILWTYGGWQENIFVAGETKDAARSLPFALIGTVIIISCAYVLLNVFFLCIIPPEKMISSPLVAAQALNIIYGGLSAKLVDILVVICSIGAINAMIISGSRITYALGADQPIFRTLTFTTTKNNTPIAALLLNSLGACFFVILGSFDRLLFFTGIAVWLFCALSIASLFIFRKRYPTKVREFNVPFYPWLPGIFVIICTALCLDTFFTYVEQSLFGIGLICCGIPAFYLSQYLGNNNFLNQRNKNP